MRHTLIIVTHYGGLDALQVVEDECPKPKGGEVSRYLDSRTGLERRHHLHESMIHKEDGDDHT